MPPSLRRSCGACASAKSRCDLRTPKCSRCERRQVRCVYANQPLSTLPGPNHDVGRFSAVDPFESYPRVRLPRQHVQRLIHSFLNRIAFQYYPLDLDPKSNPFLISWWPLALGDPTLFHVSLQTASLDEEFFSRRGFQASELLMIDSVALLRQKMNSSLAAQDGTINSVITLATIEYGKGNIETAEMHISGAKQLVHMRGGIQAVMQTSPLTARMVSWTSMIITGTPQFPTQDDNGTGEGVGIIPEWTTARIPDLAELPISRTSIDAETWNIYTRIYGIFKHSDSAPLTPTKLHDLTSFAIHRLLTPLSTDTGSFSNDLSSCLRLGVTIYMLLMQGPTYYTHLGLMGRATAQLASRLSPDRPLSSALDLWLVAVGLAAAHNTALYQSFQNRARFMSEYLQLGAWSDCSKRIKDVLWLRNPDKESVFQSHWDTALGYSCEVVMVPFAQIAPVNVESPDSFLGPSVI